MNPETYEENHIESSEVLSNAEESAESDRETLEVFILLSHPPYLERLVELCDPEEFMKKAKEHASQFLE